MKKNDIKAKISNLSDIQDKFFYISILNLLDTKNYINLKKENMIFLKPNFKYLIPNDYINRKNYDIAFFYNLKDVKKINYINSKEFISSGYPYLIIVRDNGEDDNIIIILKTPLLRKKTKQTGGAIEIDQDLEDHDPNLFPSDPHFDGNVVNTKTGYKNYESGFSKGFDSGYNKGYYFGYSAASAYLYRFYKKYYSDYMNKYQEKIKNETNQYTEDEKNRMLKESNLLLEEIDRLKNQRNELNEQKIENQEKEKQKIMSFQNMNLNNISPTQNIPSPQLNQNLNSNLSDSFYNQSNSISPANSISSANSVSSPNSVSSANSISSLNTKITSQNINSPIQIGGRKSYYNYKKLNTLDEYQGLPLYMLPENLYVLDSLNNTKGIFKFINNLLNPPKPYENPKFHCYKLDKQKLDKVIKNNIDSRFRDAVIGIESNWNDKIFRKSCNREILKFMNYCDDETHAGVKYNTKLKAYTKECKLRKDNKKKSSCLIM